MASRRRQRRPDSAPNAAAATASPDGSVEVDDETRRALALFNERLTKQAEQERAQKRIEKAARAKDDAAARVRSLESDSKATAEQRAEAAAAYHAAVATLDRLRRGEPEPEPAPDSSQDSDERAEGEAETTGAEGAGGDAAAETTRAGAAEAEPVTEH